MRIPSPRTLLANMRPGWVVPAEQDHESVDSNLLLPELIRNFGHTESISHTSEGTVRSLHYEKRFSPLLFQPTHQIALRFIEKLRRIYLDHLHRGAQ